MTNMIAEAFEALKANGGRESKVQRDYADHVQKVIECANANDFGQALVEAETGVGKTLGYLIPILLDVIHTGRRAVISTYTLALQQQIVAPGGDMEKALDAVEKITGRRPTFAKRIGRRNFVDPLRALRWCDEMAKQDLSPEQTVEWEAFRDWVEASRDGRSTGEIREYLEGVFPRLPGHLEQDDVCLTPDSGKRALAQYVAHIEKSKHADVVVTNHALLVRAAMHGVRLFHDVEGDRQIGVMLIDEADRLPAVARDATSDLLPFAEMEQALLAWNKQRDDNAGGALLSAVQEMRDLLADLRPANTVLGKEGILLWTEMPHGWRRDVLTAMARLVETSRTVLLALGGDKSEDGVQIDDLLGHYIALCGSILADMAESSFGEGRDSLLALRWSPSRHFPSVKKFRLFPGRVLKSLWNEWQGDDKNGEEEKRGDKRRAFRAGCMILTSATISSPSKSRVPDFLEMKMELGVFDKTNPCSHLHASFSPSSFGHAEFVFPDPSGPAVYLDGVDDDEDESGKEVRINPEWVKYVADMVCAAHDEKNGRVLVLANSYLAAGMISAELRKRGLAPVEKTRERRTDECLRKVVEEPRSIFVSPSAWEGLDLQFMGVKNAFRHVVATQLPYQSLDGAREAAIRRHLRGQGKDEKNAEMFGFVALRSAALRKIRQGFGRGIRAHDDHMTFWVSDPRFPLPELFTQDIGGAVPYRIVGAHQSFAWAIPRRFRDAMEQHGRIFLRNGRILSAEDLLVV